MISVSVQDQCRNQPGGSLLRAIIFANGVMNFPEDGFAIRPEEDLLIAADGGLRHCLARGLTPHVLVGDMDSVDPSDLARINAHSVDIREFEPQKDETDLQLALEAAVQKGCNEIVILSALGARWDMTLGNVTMLAAPFLEGIDVRILDGAQEIRCLRGPGKIRLDGCAGDRLSLIPVTASVAGITLAGLAFPLVGETLRLGSTRGLSNEFLGSTADVEIQEGILLITKISQPSDCG
jgi:thiamine pyrophosphokinase